MDYILLEAKTKRVGLTSKSLAEAIGIDSTTFYRKKRGVVEFKRNEIKNIKEVLNLSESEIDLIFFNQ